MPNYKNLYFLTTTASHLIKPSSGSISEWYRRFEFTTGKWRRYGLYHDDLLYEYPHVAEAVRRLPTAMREERDFRQVRAVQMDITQELLPRDQWPTYEEDITKGRYLQPYIAEVLAELKEMDDWEAVN